MLENNLFNNLGVTSGETFVRMKIVFDLIKIMKITIFHENHDQVAPNSKIFVLGF